MSLDGDVSSAYISSVATDQQDILQAIGRLYTGGTFECDPTFSRGNFYKGGIPEPPFKFDLVPQRDDVVQSDCRHLPLGAAIISSLVYDPPFLHAHGVGSVIGERFGSYPRQHDLRAMYFASLVEFYRVLKPKGILVVKCQDIVESGKQVWNHVYFWEMATNLGFEALDLFIQISGHRLIGHNHHEQKHARKGHCYWWVFQKSARR